MSKYRKQYGKLHAAQASSNVKLRDSVAWDRYYHPDLRRFVSKTGAVSVGHRSVRASDLYRSAYTSQLLSVPKGYLFSNESARLVKKRKLRGDESDRDGILYRGAPPAFQPHEFQAQSILPKGTYSIAVEYYGAPDSAIDDPKRTRGHHTGSGENHRRLQVFGKQIVMNGFPVVLSCLAERNFTTDGSHFAAFKRAPQAERIYFTGSDDFVRLLSLVPEGARPLFLSRIDVAKVVSVVENPPPSGHALSQIPAGDDEVAQILSHPLATLRLTHVDGVPRFESTAPICEADDCVLEVLVRWKQQAFRERLGINLTKAWLIDLLGTSGTRVSTQEMKPFFRRFRLKFTALNVAGEIVDSYSPETDGMKRNKRLDNIHLIFVLHNAHIYVLDKHKQSTERRSRLTAGDRGELRPPRDAFVTPPLTAYDGGYAHTCDDLLRLPSLTVLAVTNVTTDTASESVRIGYTGSIDALFLELRRLHNVEAQCLIKKNQIAALTLHLQGRRVTICDVPSKAPAAFTQWLNTFKKAFFHNERKSLYSNNLRRVFTELRKAQLVARFCDAPHSAVGVDVSRFYTRAGIDIDNIPVFLPTDDFVPYRGEPLEDWNIYLVTNDTLNVERYLIADRRVSAVSGYVLRRAGLVFDIRHVIKPAHLAANPFAALVKELYAWRANERCDECGAAACSACADYNATATASIHKHVPLHLIGISGKMVAQNERAFFTTCSDEAHALGSLTAVPKLGGYFATRSSATVTLSEGYYPFQFLVYDLARLQMLACYRELRLRGATVYGVLTDKFFVDSIPDDMPMRGGGLCAVEDIGSYRSEKAKPVPQSFYALKDGLTLDNNVPAFFRDVGEKRGNNTLIIALHAGGGKTHASFQNLDPTTTLAIAPTNLQCESLARRFGCPTMTVARFMGHRVVEDGVQEKSPASLVGIKTVVIDELYQNSLSLIVRLLRQVPTHPSVTWIANGDSMQNTNHETANNIERDAYLERVLPAYFPDRVTLTSCHRLKLDSDKRVIGDIRAALLQGASTRDILARFGLKQFNTVEQLKAAGIKKAVTLSNATAHVLNQNLNSGCADAAGMLVISKEWHKDLVMNKTYVVEKVIGKYYVINEKAYRRNMFRLPNSLTCHSIQGETIREPYAVFDALSINADKNWLYTALTRGEYLSNVWVHVGEPLFPTFKLRDKLRSLKDEDKAKGREFDLDYGWCVEFMKQANYACAVCYERVELNYDADDPRQFSFDRIYNGWGHIKSNIRLTHFGCNRRFGTEGKNLALNEETDMID